MFSWGFNCLRCAASKMTTVATRRMNSGSEEGESREEEDRSHRSRRSEDGEDDSGLVCDDVSGHMAPSSSSSRSSIFSNDGKFQDCQSRSDEGIHRGGNTRQMRKSSGLGSDQSLSGREGDGEVFGSYGSDGYRGNRKTRGSGFGPVNVIVQHNMDGTVTAKAVTPTEYTERDFTSYSGNRAPKSLSMNDIGNVTRRNGNQSDKEDYYDLDDVDGVFHVRRMIRDNSMELFSLPEYRAEPAEANVERSRKNQNNSNSTPCPKELTPQKGKAFKPLFVFPGGENIPERDCDAVIHNNNSRKSEEFENSRDESSVTISSGYVGMTREYNVTYHHRSDNDGYAHVGMPMERMGPVGAEQEKRYVERNGQRDPQNSKSQVDTHQQPRDLPDSLKNADMYESITGPTASKVEEELQTYEPPDYHRQIPELGISEGSLAAGDAILYAASGKMPDMENPIGEDNFIGARPTENNHSGFAIPKENIGSEGISGNTLWETNLREKMAQPLSPWLLVDRAGKNVRLPATMIFLGREDCDITIQSRSVDKRHAVLTFDQAEEKFNVKDLGSINGTFVNENRIPEQEYVTLGDLDTVRFGYVYPMVYRMERIEEETAVATAALTLQQPQQQPTVAAAAASPQIERTETAVPEETNASDETEIPVDERSGASGEMLTGTTELPHWARKEGLPGHHVPHTHGHSLAECQGCIVEQDIRHTCGGLTDGPEYAVAPSGGELVSHPHAPHSHRQHPHIAHQIPPVGHPQQPPPPHRHYDPAHVRQVPGQHIHEYSDQHWRDFPQGVPYEYLQTSRSSGNLTSVHHQQVVKEQFIASGGAPIRPRPGIPPELRSSQQGIPTDVRGSPAPGQYVQKAESATPPNVGSEYHTPGQDYSVPRDYQVSPREYHARSHGEVYSRVGPAGYSLPPRDYPVPHHYCDCHLTKVHHYQGDYHHHDNYKPLSQSQEQFIYEQRRHSYGELHFRNVTPHVVDIPLDEHSVPSQHHYGDHETNLHKSHVQYLAHPGAPTSHGRPITPHDYPSVSPAHLTRPPELGASTPRLSTGPYTSETSITPHSVSQTDVSYTPASNIDSSGYISASESKLTESIKLDSTLDTLRMDDDMMLESSETIKAEEEEDELSDVPTKDVPLESSVSSVAQQESVTQRSEPDGAQPAQAPLGRTGSAVMYIDFSETGSPENKDKSGSPVKSPGTPGSPSMPRVDKRRSLTGEELIGLDTVKKGTPLYGQPDWWGEDVQAKNNAQGQNTANSKENGKSPSSAESAEPEIDMSKYKNDPKYACTYMEIPQQDINKAERDFGLFGPTEPTSPTEKDKGSSEQSAPAEPPPAPAMAFTIDFSTGDAKMCDKDKLSKFNPVKGRRSFRSRSTKQKSEDADDDKQEGDSPVRERSPIHREDSRRSAGYHSDGHHSNFSSDNEDLSIRSDTTGINKNAKKPPVSRKSSTTKRPEGRRSTTPRGTTSTSSPRMTRRPLSTGPPTGPPRSTTTVGSPGMKRRTNTTSPKPIASTSTVTRKSSVKSPAAKHQVGAESKSANVTTRKVRQSAEHDLKKAEIKETVVVTSTTTNLSVPKPSRSSQGGGKRAARRGDEKRDAEKDEDNLSETGTYTIESDAVSKEIDDARRSIDQAFGIEDGPEGRHRRLLDSNGNIELDDTDDDDVGEELPHDREAANAAHSSSQPELTGENTPGWVAQWAATTRTRSSPSLTNENQDISDVKRSESFQEDGKRSRPGTGRILPVPPSQSPPRKSDSPRGRVRPTKSPRQEEPGKPEDEDKDEMWRRDPRSADPAVDIDYFFQSQSNGRPATETARSGHSSHYETYRSDSPLRSESPLTSRSSASLATNVLLGDTNEVVQAVRERRSHHESSQNYSSRSNGQSDGFVPIRDPDSDTEKGSFFAIVDGHGHWRNSSGDSPRSGYGRSVSEPHTTKTQSVSVARAREDLSAVTKPLSTKPKEKTYILNKSSRQSSNFDSEHSESESILSTSTDYSYSETPSPKMSRKGSGGKGPMSMTRPNRAFELRRLKADSESEGGNSPRGTARPKSAGRPTSAGSSRSNSTSASTDVRRNRPSSARDTARSDASLGAAIVKKSRENAHSTTRRAESLSRTDNGRSSLRTIKQGNLSTAQSVRRSPDPRELRSKSATPKSMMAGRSGLSVTGVNKSQPNSRSSSPRSEEYSAWKRRKGYDPRQAVVDAKAAKTKSNKASRMERAKSVGASASQDEDLSTDRWRKYSRHDTISSVSSDGGDFGEDDLDSERTDEITRISAELRSKVDAMAKSINTDRAIGAADRSLESSFHSLLFSKTRRSAFSALGTPHVRKRGSSSSSSSASSSFTTPSSAMPTSPPPPPVPTTPKLSEKSRRRHRNTPPAPPGGSTELTTNGWNGTDKESYEDLLLSSIYHLSIKVMTQTDRIIDNMRDRYQVNDSPSPIDDLLHQTPDAAKCQQLTEVLRNLRKTEHRLQVMHSAMFPGSRLSGSVGSIPLRVGGATELSDTTEPSGGHPEYLRELERIRTEIAGFQPIEQHIARSRNLNGKSSSIDDDPFTGDEYY